MQQGIKSIDGIQCEGEKLWGMALQLLLSHMFVAGVTTILFIWLSMIGLSSTLAIGIVLLLGGSLGLLLTWNIQYALWLLCETLLRLSQGLPVDLGEMLWWYWPFKESFTALTTLNQRIRQHVEQIQLSQQYRTQLLQQASHTAALEQRHRRACELHEEIALQIFSVSLSAAAAQAYRDPSGHRAESVQAVLEDIRRHAQGAQVELQALRQQLHSAALAHDSLTDALQTLVDTLGYHTGATLQITLEDLPDPDRLPRAMQELIFHIAQEACDNITRHADPQHIWLALEQQEQALRLKVRDDGCGFDLAQVRQGRGLAHMHERTAALKGSISIQSQRGQGTSICVIIPLLRTLPEQLELQELEWDTRHKFASVRASMQIGEWSALTTLVCMTLYASYGNMRESLLCCALILFFSLSSTIYGYLRAQIILSHIALTSDEHTDEVQALRLRLRGWRIWKYQLALAGSWYLVSLLHGWHDERIVLELAAASVGLLFLVLREHSTVLDARRQWYTYLAPAEIRWELQRWQQTLSRQGKGWCLGMGCYILLTLGSNGTLQPQGMSLRFSDDAPTLMLVLWGLQLLLAALISQRELRSLARRQDQA